MKQRFFAKEVVQTSNMDCGVASLKCLLDSFDIDSNYEYLRDVCKTDVNGTSIDRLEEVLNDIGFNAEQMIVPPDQIGSGDPTLYPAIAVVDIGNNIAHFVVIWRQLGAYLQIVDPAQGRYWIRAEKFAQNQLYHFSDHLPAEYWQQCFNHWQRIDFLSRQSQHLGITQRVFEQYLNNSGEDWQCGAKADAILRFIHQLAREEKQFKGQMAQKLFVQLFDQLNSEEQSRWFDIIPVNFWRVRPPQNWYLEAAQQQQQDVSDQVYFSGAVLLKIQPSERLKQNNSNSEQTQDSEIQQALSTPNVSPIRSVLDFLKTVGKFSPMVILLSTLVVTMSITAQAVAFKMLFEFDNLVAPGPLRTQIALVIFFIVAGIAVVNIPLQLTVQKLSRRLEDQFRIALYEKLPKLKDDYFSSRLLSDLIERSHSVAAIENIPTLSVELIQALVSVLLIFAGLIYLVPEHAPLLIAFALLCIVLPLLAQKIVGQKDMVTRTLAGTLTRHYANALLGLFAVKVHSGENTVLSEQQQSLTRWAKASNRQRKTTLALSFTQDLITYGFAGYLIAQTVNAQTLSAPNILYVYWLLLLPTKAETLFILIQQTPMVRNIILRLQEPLGSAEDAIETAQPQTRQTDQCGMHIQFQNADFSVAGEAVLQNVSIDIEPGKHIAVVGASGAGKSTFISALMGFAELEQGKVLVDSAPLSDEVIAQLRQQSTWLDPQVYLFDRSIIDNITYGSGHTGHMGEVLDEADLWPLIEGMPDSIHSDCGEAGSQLSGGEGQRIRLARALNKPNVRLALLDEPFRGLDKPTRQRLMNTVREKWRDITFICVIHDVSEALQFDHVAVFDQGQIVEQGSAQELLERGSALNQLLDNENQVADRWLNNSTWRRMTMHQGKLEEAPNE